MTILTKTALERDKLKMTHLWVLGEWDRLSKMNTYFANESEISAEIAALVMLANIHNSDIEQAIELQDLEKLKKYKVNSIKAVVSSLYSTLSNTYFILEEYEKSEDMIRKSMSLHLSDSEIDLYFRIRQNNQEIEISNKRKKVKVSPVTKIISCVPLGDAWASNTINTVIFRSHALLYSSGFQYAAYYTNVNNIRVVKRHIDGGQLYTFNIEGDYNLRDSHNSISMGIDKAGIIHLSYDHHASKLKYRKTTSSHDISSWTEEISMTGRYEDIITYPTFIIPRENYPLTLIYRHGVHDRGAAYIKTYDETQDKWNDHPHPLFSGNESKPWTSNAYWNHPAIGNDGAIFLSFVWRNSVVGDGSLINNVNIGFACSFNNGESWLTSKLDPYRIPITQTSAEVVFAVPPCSNLMNQTSMAVDSMNHPHIVFYSNDKNNIPQYQHLWFDGKEWNHQYISQRKVKFNLSGRGTLRLPMSRPEIIIDEFDSAIIIFRADYTNDKISYLYLKGPNYEWDGIPRILYDENVGFSEPIIDKELWNKRKILSIFIQKCNQPDNDSVLHEELSKCSIVDFKFFSENE